MDQRVVVTTYECLEPVSVTNGQTIQFFGEQWRVIDADGKVIHTGTAIRKETERVVYIPD